MLALPLMGETGPTCYNIKCPASGAIGTGQIIDAGGIPLGPNINGVCAVYYQMPTAAPQFTTLVGHFRIAPFLNTTENIELSWVEPVGSCQ